MLVFKNAKICVTPNVKPQRQSVEYRLRWVPNAKLLVGHVHFIFLGVDLIQVGTIFQWNMGLIPMVNLRAPIIIGGHVMYGVR